MVKILHKNFNRQVDKQTASDLTLGEVIDTNPALAMNREAILSGTQSFVELWSRLSKTMRVKMNMRIVNQINKNPNNPMNTGRFSSSNKKQRQHNNNSIDLAMLMPVSYLLPATHGDGIYIYALIVFLVEAQNEFVQFYRGLVSATRASISRASGSSSSTSLVSSATTANAGNNNAAAVVGRVDLDELSEASCICVEPRRDLLLNTVYVCSNYSLECASELSFEYDYAKIQRIVEARFVARKPIIETSVRNFNFNF